MDRLLDVLAVLSLVLLFTVLRSLRRSHIRVEYSVSWLLAAAAVFVLSRSHGLLLWIGGALRMREPAIALIFLILLVFLGVFYRFSRIISQLRDTNITLAQKLAILEFGMQGGHGRRQEEGQQ